MSEFQLLQNLQQLDPVLESNYSKIPNGSLCIQKNLTMNKSKALRDIEFLLYETDEQIRIDVQTDGDTVWLSLTQTAELFAQDRSVVSRHIRNAFGDKRTLWHDLVSGRRHIQISPDAYAAISP